MSAMAPEDELKKRTAMKLTKKKKDPRQSIDIPERFRDGDDAQDDVTAPRGKTGQYMMNQSVFSMIAAAGSKVDFHSRFDGDSSESEEEKEEERVGERKSTAKPSDTLDDLKSEKHRQKLSEHKLLKSLPKLGLKTMRDKNRSDRKPSSSSDAHIQSPSDQSLASKDAPVMSRMLAAQAKLRSMNLGHDARHGDEKPEDEDSGEEPSGLAIRLMEIFGFESPEDVIEEYPCWLLKSVLLQGYMYITTKHICFYAYLPKKSNVVVKSGYLSKRGRQNPKFTRYWFRLVGDVLSYYTDPSDLYFPSGNIDLRYGISATNDSKEKGKDYTGFTVVTNQRKYQFKADSAASAREWVRSLQKIIFRSHNEGDSVKISLPIENVIDIEDSPVVEFAETCKIRVVDNDETYAIDEVCAYCLQPKLHDSSRY
jgi:sterol 3beta-glucosyltransferase